mmetsp:Transcript_21732/g.66882  ORF Transcript_21732/g.66882 Transcript_21732/m.66882 type:complete len:217 (-) Transcript_21732:137-787(-)
MRVELAIFLALALAVGDGLFVILDQRRECFVVEEPLDTQLTVRYELPHLETLERAGSGSVPGSAPVAVKLTLVDRHTESIVFSRVVGDRKGEAALSTVSEAAHDLCIRPVRNTPGRPFRFGLEVERGNGDRYYAQMAAENHMDRLQVEVVKLNDELAEILNEADYMKEKEVRFHRKAERVNLAAIWWPILQIAILVLTAAFQVQSLKSYFQTRSLY